MRSFCQKAGHITLLGLCSLTLVAGCTDHSIAPGSNVTPAPAFPIASTKGPATPITTALIPTFVQYSSPISLGLGVRLIGSAGGSVSAGHFTLTIPPGALTVPLPIVLTETNVLYEQCSIEPTGTSFKKPVTLTYSYASTSADPASPNYIAGGVLTGEWFDPSSSAWTAIGGSDDAAAKSFSASMNHLSYYALAK